MNTNWISKCEKCGTLYDKPVPYCINPKNGCLDYVIEKIEYPKEGGTWTHIVGMKYPFEGYPDHLTLGLNATVKRALISTVKLFTRIVRGNITNASIDWLSEVYEAEYEKYQIAENRLSRPAKEILRVGLKFATRPQEQKAVWCIAMFVEMDNAYRYRLQDILPLIDKKKPIRKEILRITDILTSREQNGIEWKWKMLRIVIGMILVKPHIKKTIKAMIDEIDMELIKPKPGDLYYMARYFDYNFQGLPYEIRASWKAQEDETYIPQELNPAKYANVDVRPNKFFYKMNEEDAEKLIELIKSRLQNLYKQNNVQGRMDNPNN